MISDSSRLELHNVVNKLRRVIEDNADDAEALKHIAAVVEAETNKLHSFLEDLK